MVHEALTSSNVKANRSDHRILSKNVSISQVVVRISGYNSYFQFRKMYRLSVNQAQCCQSYMIFNSWSLSMVFVSRLSAFSVSLTLTSPPYSTKEMPQLPLMIETSLENPFMSICFFSFHYENLERNVLDMNKAFSANDADATSRTSLKLKSDNVPLTLCPTTVPEQIIARLRGCSKYKGKRVRWQSTTCQRH